MSGQNFVEKYDLEKTLSKVRVLVDKPDYFGLILSIVLGLDVDGKNYSVKQLCNSERIGLGRFSSGKVYPTSNALVLEADVKSFFFKQRKPVSILKYEYFKLDKEFFEMNPSERNPLSIGKIGIDYIQTPGTINPSKQLPSLKENLGSHAHEFLLAHFIARIGCVLDAFPETVVELSNRYNNMGTSYACLRDRFFDNQWFLNPNKERVKQILGPENAWLKYRQDK